jgi:integrase
MSKELKVSFYLKRESRLEKSSNGENVAYPIIGKIIIGNSIAQFATKLKVEERLWHVKSGRSTGKSHTAVRLNREINKINLTIHAHYSDILKRTGTVSAVQVKNAFQGIASSQKTLFVLFEEMMSDFKARIGIDRSEATYEQHGILYRQLKLFLREKYNVEDIPLNQLDLPFIEALDFYFRVKRVMKPRTVKARIILLNKAIRLALYRNYITRPPFEGFDVGKIVNRDRSLTSDELDLLISTPLKSSTQRFIRDMFVFSTFTGLSYVDLQNLSWKDIITEDDSSRWISSARQKTKTMFNVKLLDIPIQIMEYYKGIASDGKVFPYMNIGQVNVGLKRIARNCGINKALTFHQSRYSFASQICLSQGVPIESVSRMMGHKHIQTTQRYARLNSEKIGNDMKELSSRLAGKFGYAK